MAKRRKPYTRKLPRRHSRAYKVCVLLAFIGALSLLALGLTAFAYFRRQRAALRPTAARHVTADQDVQLAKQLKPSQGGGCGEMFPTENVHTGSYRMMVSQVMCLFNASGHYRPSAWRFPLGKIPGLLCGHVLYWSVSLSNAIELESRAEVFDYTCKGLESVADLKRRFMAIKVHLVLSAMTPHENARLSDVAESSQLLSKLTNEVKAWVKRFEFDGIFIAWSAPRGPNNTVTLFRTLAEVLNPRYSVGAILPTSQEALGNYDLPGVFAVVDWFIASTHGLNPGPSWNRTSCSSPYKDGKHDSIQLLLRYYWNRLNDEIDPRKFCFSVSPAAVGYKVSQDGVSLDMPAKGPASITGESRDPGVLRYSQVCGDEGRASKDLSGQCLYNRWGDTWVAFENAKSTGARVKSIMRWIAGVKHLSNASVAYCMAIWDLDLDDHRAECGDKPFPIVDAAVNELP
ncbi:chitinase-3-like protein 1 [Haemaphysalis longicornis]